MLVSTTMYFIVEKDKKKIKTVHDTLENALGYRGACGTGMELLVPSCVCVKWR